MQTLLHDLRYGLRMLRRSPGFTAVAVLTLALGIGANAAIFSVVNAVLWRSLPYRDPDRLVIIWGRKAQEGSRNIEISPLDVLDWRQQNRVFTQMEAFGGGSFILGGLVAQPGEPERVVGQHVTSGFFGALGVEAALGRTFLPEEDQKRVVVLSHRLWHRRFGGDPKLLGQSVILDGSNYTVIGIMPSGFRFYRRDAELWTPLALAGQPYSVRHNRFLSVFARLKPGVSLEQARAEMEVITSRLEQHYPDTNAGFRATLVPLKEQYFGGDPPRPAGLAGSRRVRAPDRLRQHGQPAVGACRGAPKGDRGPHSARRRALATDPAVAHGNLPARLLGRRRRAAARFSGAPTSSCLSFRSASRFRFRLRSGRRPAWIRPCLDSRWPFPC